MSNHFVLAQMSVDPVLAASVERARIAEKVEKDAAEKRSGPSAMDELEVAAEATMRRIAAREPTAPMAHDVDVDMSDVDVDLVGGGGFADAHHRRLGESIQGQMIDAYPALLNRVRDPEFRAALLAREDAPASAKRRARDTARVGNELRKPGYRAPAKVESEPELTGTALIEQAAAADLARLLAPKRTRRR